jgi:hypothetical protein
MDAPGDRAAAGKLAESRRSGGTPQQINYFLTEAQILDLNGFSFQSNIN